MLCKLNLGKTQFIQLTKSADIKREILEITKKTFVQSKFIATETYQYRHK